MIPFNQYQAFKTDYYNGKYPHQRLGQAFLNHFFPYVTDPKLFYTENESEAEKLIFKSYVHSGKIDLAQR